MTVNSLRHGILERKKSYVAQKFHFYKILQSWFIFTNKEVNYERNAKINKESFKVLIIGT